MSPVAELRFAGGSDDLVLPDEDVVVDITAPKRMVSPVDCRAWAPGCPEVFTGPRRWLGYVRHIREAHPNPSPALPDPEPEPPAQHEPPAIGGDKEAAMAEVCPVPNCGKEARHKGRHRNQGAPAPQAASPAPKPATARKPKDQTRRPESERFPRVAGRCPACGSSSLFLGEGGYVTCSVQKCPDPTAAADPYGAPYRAAKAGEWLNRFGWHLEGCPAYYHPLDGTMARTSDDRAHPCSCGFREALEAVMPA